MSQPSTRRETWQRLLAEQQASGLSITAWCLQQNISEATYYYWRKRLAPSLSVPQQWMALEPSPAGAPSGLTLRVGRIAVEVLPDFDAHVLAAVLTVLEARC